MLSRQMRHLLYSDLVPWYDLLDPVADHAEEGDDFTVAFERAISPSPVTLLELGAGAGNNGFHLKRRFRCTLTDLSEDMLGLSRAQNPECEHVLGDMRTLRLGRVFDAVLVHDGICYMTSEADLRAVFVTAWEHLRPGGAAIFAPDLFRETFTDAADLHEGDDGDRSLRCLSWVWDPDPTDDVYSVEYAFLLRHGTEMMTAHDTHVEGLFSRATWERLLADVGFQVEALPRPIGDGGYDSVFLARKPG